MLNLILGRCGSGKTEYCFSQIERIVSGGGSGVLLLTPEQYNFTAEKRLLSMLGESGVNCVQNFSFTRLANEIKRLYGGGAVPVLSKGAKAVLMKKAIDGVKDELCVFSGKTRMVSFVKSMSDIYDEMKSCGKSCAQIKEAAQSVNKKMLSAKLSDISLVTEEYERLTAGVYADPADELSYLCARLRETGYLKGKTVFVDGFNGFVASEMKILQLIIEECREVYVTLTTDSFKKNDDYSLFSYINKTARALSDFADSCKAGVKTVMLTENHRARSRFIAACERGLYSPVYSAVNEKPDCVKIYKAKDVSDECSHTALMIKKLLRKGVRAREITVICRDAEKYRNELSYAFRKHEIPFFDDERQSAASQPVMVFVSRLLRCAAYSMRTEDVLCLAKTGLTELDGEDVSRLENYVYMWSISGMKKWGSDFVNSTKGFTSDITPSDAAALKKINAAREYLFTRINAFKNAVSHAGAKKISESVYNALTAFKVDKQLASLAGDLEQIGRNALAAEQERVWDMLMEILNDLAVVLGDEEISAADYAQLFSITLQAEDLGVLPQGIDCVQFGQADRIRPDNPRAVFVLGANEGEFPKSVFSGGLLSESDRIVLNENDFTLYSFGETLTFQERFFAYAAASCAREYLFASYIANARNDAPSSLITSLLGIFPCAEPESAESIPEAELIESTLPAFELMARKYADNTVFSESLKEYFRNDERYNAVRLLWENGDIKIDDGEKAVKLFGRDMYLSASRLEDYFTCSFRYFCKFGLGARPLQKAQMNAMQTGTVIHYVLENVLKDIGTKALAKESEGRIKLIVNKYLREYFETQLGETNTLSKRFEYQFMRLSKMLYSVILRLAQEFSQSEFEAKAFELKIDRDADVRPAEIALENGSVRIRGAVDRVDMLDKNGVRYVRVVDYKSGSKDFRLSDVLYGLNLQMFVYLFAICGDKNSEYSGVPAGVLYMHAARGIYNLSQDSAEDEIRKKSDSEYRMKGVVLYDEEHDILNDMENGVKGRYIPVKTGAKGVTGCFASLEGLGRISKKINSLVAEMGNSLHSGNIPQNPIDGKGHDKTCEFCDYSYVCANRRMIDRREMQPMRDDEVIALLKEE